MDVIVTNRMMANQYSFQSHGQRTAMISITNTGNSPNEIHFGPPGNIDYVLFLFFDDVEKDCPNAMTEYDAKEVADFVMEHKNNVDGFIVHCDAGVSRSAGVAAAIMKYLNNDDMPIFQNPRYCPNMHCYRLTLSALFPDTDIYGTTMNEIINEKEQISIDCWAKANNI